MNLAFLTPNIHHGTAAQIWPSMARNIHNNRLFIFPGGRLGAESGVEMYKNKIYNLVNGQNFERGITWVSALAGIVSEDGVRTYHQRIPDMSWISIGAELPGSASITIDAYSGMGQLLDHFYSTHSCSRFVFIRGPRAHSSANDRYRAFVDFIHSKGLSIQDQILLGPAQWTQGGEVIEEALRVKNIKPGQDFQVLIGSSDLQTYHGVLALQNHGYTLLQDYLAGGFNNSPESRLLNPGFTTVEMPFADIGVQGILLAANKIKGSQVISPRLIIRKSCGCFQHKNFADRVNQKTGEDPQVHPAPDTLADTILVNIQGGERERTAWVQPVADGLMQSLESQRGEDFLTIFQGVLDDVSTGDQSVSVWQDALTGMHRFCIGLEPRIDQIWLDGLFEEARILVSDTIEKKAVQSAWKSSQIYSAIQNFEHSLWGFAQLSDLSALFQYYLPQLEIESAYLVMLSENESNLVAGFASHGILDDTIPIPKGKILPEIIGKDLPAGGTWFVLPLCDDLDFYGYFVVQYGVENPAVYEQLRIGLTGALRGYTLIEQVRQARDVAKKAEELKARFLSNAGNELREPVLAVQAILSQETRTSKTDGILRQKLQSLAALTMDLEDFSRAQGDDLLIETRLLDLPQFLKEVDSRWIQGTPVPLVNADNKRILQVIRGIRETFAQQGRVDLGCRSLLVDKDGVHLVLEFSLANSTLNAIEEQSIGWALYRRIMILHGGNLTQQNHKNSIRLTLRFPFPSIDTNSISTTVLTSPLLIVGKPRNGIIEQLKFLGLEVHIPSRDTFFADMPGKYGGIVFDGETAEPKEWTILSRVKNLSSSDGVPLVVYPGDAMDLTMVHGNVWDELIRHSGVIGIGPIVILQLGETNPRDYMGDNNLDTIVLKNSKDLSVIEAENIPRVFICLGYESGIVETIRQRKNWMGVPIVLVSPGFNSEIPGSEGEMEKLMELTRLHFVHPGVLTSQEFSRRFHQLDGRKEIFSFQTEHMVKRAILYLDAHANQSISRWQIAEAVHVSEDYLTRIFHRDVGLSPWEYLTRLRITRGAYLLQTTGLSIQEIAGQVGFTDQAYFCRVFRKTTGTTPTKFRQQENQS